MNKMQPQYKTAEPNFYFQYKTAEPNLYFQYKTAEPNLYFQLGLRYEDTTAMSVYL